MNKKPIGILTWHYYPNFGSALQAYALQRSIEKLGYPVDIINYRNKKFGPYSEIKQVLKAALHRLTGGRFRGFAYPFPCFQRTYLNESCGVTEAKELPALCKKYGAVVCGSDQIWAPNALNPVYLLSFLPEGVDRVSYAASIGLNAIPEEMQPVYREALERFKAVSVREEKGAELIEAITGNRPAVVPDPTLLLTAEEWRRMERPVKEARGKQYLFCYFLKKNHAYRARVTEYAGTNGLTILGVSQNDADRSWMNIPDSIGPCEFLWLVRNASAVMTDSYHGTLFSLLFHKRFITIERFNSNDSICQNSRLEQLKSCFGLKEQIVPQSLPEKLCVPETDYIAFETKLAALRKDAADFLREALG